MLTGRKLIAREKQILTF